MATNTPEQQAALRKNSATLVKMFRRKASDAPATDPAPAPAPAPVPAPKDTSAATTRSNIRGGTQQAEGGVQVGGLDKTAAQEAQASTTLNGQQVVSRNLSGQAIGADGQIIRGGEAGPLGFGQGTTTDGTSGSGGTDAAGLPIPPKIPSVQDEFGRDVDNLTDVRMGAEDARVDTANAVAQEAQNISQGIKDDVAGVEEDTQSQQTQLAGEQQNFNQEMDTRRQELSTLAGDVRTEFEGLRNQFSASVQGAIGDVQGAQSAALSGVYTGQAKAMQAAVQGIQGNINTQIAQIDGNPNLTAAQKQQMKNQVKMTGAMALAPAIGATQLQFNSLAANVSTQFGQILGSVETAGLAGETQLAGASGQAFANASTVMNQMSNQILELSNTSDLAFAAQQESLIALRNQAENSGNQLLTNILPETRMAYHDYGDIYAENLQNSVQLFTEDIANQLETFGMEALQAQLALSVGTPQENFWDQILAGFLSGGSTGALVAGGVGLLSPP